MITLLAQVGGMNLISLLVIVIIVAAALAIVAVVLKQMGIAIPQYIVTILWIVLAALIGIVAIKFILSIV